MQNYIHKILSPHFASDLQNFLVTNIYIIIYIYIIHNIQYESRSCGVISVVTWYAGESVSVGLLFVVKALKDFVEHMSNHDYLLQFVCWTVSYVAFATDG